MSKTQKIVSRYDRGLVLFECELPDGLHSGLEMCHALEVATKARADLSGADLSGAYLSGAYLSGAYLSGAYLSGAYLRGAYLSHANLSHASLSHANLSHANLSHASLSHANLSYANLSYANLSGANLSGANLSGANLSGAYLIGAKWAGGVEITRPPLQLYGLRWPVSILDRHMQIGCELHSLADWSSFDDSRIAAMDGKDALRFWRENKAALLALAAADGRVPDPIQTPEATGSEK